ncbi:MAG TPA: hypothetical protein VG940_13180 [Gemmatimonadales bacterium]|nr:hypothetical protein [Gemmatimonadales bacterium]
MKFTLTISLLALAACAATEPFPPAPEEVLVVVNSTARSLTVAPTGAPNTAVTIPLGASSDVPAGLAARSGVALVPLGDDDAVAVVDLAAGTVTNSFGLAPGSGATGAAIVDDSIGYVALPGLDKVTRINFANGDTASVAVGVHPQALVFTRGRLFVLNGNVNGSGTPLGPSWITVIDPVTNAKATGIDSIPLLGPGNARSAALGADGLLYVMSAGDSGTGEGRLSIVNPVTREELASFNGFGNLPAGLGASGDRLYVASWSEGLMTFDTRLREVTRGAGEGLAIATNSSVVAGANGRIYAVSAGPCSGGTGGTAHVLRPSDLVSTGTIPLGECAVGALITTVPAAP